MSLDAGKVLAELTKLAKPKLEETAAKLRGDFLQRFGDYMEGTDLKVVDDLLLKAANYEIEAVMQADKGKAAQYAEAAEDVLRQIALVLITERLVAERQVANMIQEAALAVFAGFKEVAITVVGVAVKGAVQGLLGSVGGAVADAAGEFLG